MIVFLITLVISNKFYIQNTGIAFLNRFLEIDIFALFFICLCFLFIINGSNLIDGYNGLLGIHTFIILANLFFVNYFGGNYDLAFFIFYGILIIIFFLQYNFPKATVFLGDGGSYFLGAFIALSVINTSVANPSISPFYFCILLFYLFFEVFFSFIRKIVMEKKSPLFPDKKHLHMLLYKILLKKNNNKSKSNYLVSIIINLVYLTLILPPIFFMKNGMFCKYYSLVLFIIYIFCTVVNPINKNLLEAKIIQRLDLSDLMLKLWISKPENYSFKPGQYCTIGVNGIERAYSIASSPDEDSMELFIELVDHGELSPIIWKMKAGDKLTLRPRAKGIFQIKDTNYDNYLLICTVTGIVPYVSYVRYFLNNNSHNMKFHILQGSSYMDEFGYSEELLKIAKEYPDFVIYHPTVSRPNDIRNEKWQGMTGRVNNIVEDYINEKQLNKENTIVYACGNPDMIIDIKDKLGQNIGFKVLEERFWK